MFPFSFLLIFSIQIFYSDFLLRFARTERHSQTERHRQRDIDWQTYRPESTRRLRSICIISRRRGWLILPTGWLIKSPRWLIKSLWWLIKSPWWLIEPTRWLIADQLDVKFEGVRTFPPRLTPLRLPPGPSTPHLFSPTPWESAWLVWGGNQFTVWDGEPVVLKAPALSLPCWPPLMNAPPLLHNLQQSKLTYQFSSLTLPPQVGNVIFVQIRK